MADPQAVKDRKPSGTDYHELPTNPELLAKVLDAHVERESRAITPRVVMWHLFSMYLNGVREFPVLNFRTGEIKYNYINDWGRLVYQHNKLISTIDKTVNQLAEMDVSPHVSSGATGLASHREASVAQTILSAMVNPTQMEQSKSHFLHKLHALGACGLCFHLERHPGMDLPNIDAEVVHPAEILFYPSVGMDRTKIRGKIRRRYVPIEYVQSRYGKKSVAKNREKMDIWKTMHGNHTSPHGYYGNSGTTPMSAFSSTDDSPVPVNTKMSKMRYQEIVEMREVWLDGPNGTCSRYIVQFGDWIATDKDFTNEVYYCPLIVETLIDTGSPYGYGLCDMLMPLNRETESMLAKLFENVRVADRFGILMLPQGTFDHKTKFHETKHGLVVGYWEPEAWYGQIKPYEVKPSTAGDAPGRTAAMAEQLADSYAPVPAVTQGEAPGRVDSASALQFLGKQANNINRGGIRAVRSGFGRGYQSVLPQAILTMDRSADIPIRTMDEAILGVVVDPEKKTMRMSENPVPTSAGLRFDIRDKEPRDILARKSELLELHQMQVITTQQLLMTNVKEQLMLPIYSPEVEAAYRKAQMDIVILFADGQSPGQIFGNAATDTAWVHLAVINGAMATPEFAAASGDVQKAFIDRKTDLMTDLQMVMPGGTPPPDDAALLQEADGLLMQMQQAAATMGVGSDPMGGGGASEGSGQGGFQ